MKKSFSSFKQSLPNRHIVWTYGRFSPPSSGHQLLINTILETAKNKDHIIYISETVDQDKNPLQPERKLYYLKKMFPSVNFKIAKGTFVQMAEELNSQYKSMTMIVGSDRVVNFDSVLQKYNGKLYQYESIQTISAMQRDPDSDGLSGVSGSKMRQAVKDSNYQLFNECVGGLSSYDSNNLYNEIRKAYKLEPLRETVFPIDPIRDSYYKGNMFNIGSLVIDEDYNVYNVVERRTNYVLVEDEEGNRQKKWLNELSEAIEAVKIKYDPISNKGNPKGFDQNDYLNYHQVHDQHNNHIGTIKIEAQHEGRPIKKVSHLYGTFVSNDDHPDSSGKVSGSTHFGNRIPLGSKHVLHIAKHIANYYPHATHLHMERKTGAKPDHDAVIKLDRFRKLTEQLLQEGEHSNSMMIAYMIPEEIGKQIHLGAGEKLHHLHITLSYMGKVGEDLTQDDLVKCKELLREFCHRNQPINCKISKLDKFPATEHSDGKEVIHAKIDSPELMELRENLVSFLDSNGLDKTKRNFKYTPHITLAYVPEGTEIPDHDFEPIEFTINNLSYVLDDAATDYPLNGVDEEAKVWNREHKNDTDIMTYSDYIRLSKVNKGNK